MGPWIGYFGTAASVVIAISLMQRNIRRLRIINGVGAAAFAVYGAFIAAWPVLALNTFILIVDIYYLVRMRNTDDHFDFLAVNGLRSAYVRKFIEFHLEDILRFQPGFDPADREGVKGCLILRDVRPVSIVLYRGADDGATDILLDYSVPSHRDYANARYFFNYVLRIAEVGESPVFRAVGGTKAHRQYLKKIGFGPAAHPSRPDRFEYALPAPQPPDPELA